MIGFSHACDPRASKVGRERFGLTKRNGHTLRIFLIATALRALFQAPVKQGPRIQAHYRNQSQRTTESVIWTQWSVPASNNQPAAWWTKNERNYLPNQRLARGSDLRRMDPATRGWLLSPLPVTLTQTRSCSGNHWRTAVFPPQHRRVGLKAVPQGARVWQGKMHQRGVATIPEGLEKSNHVHAAVKAGWA